MFNFNGIAIILIFALDTCALHSPSGDLFNVGTVLFTSKDLNKKRWSRTNMELLQVRRYLQSIIPTPTMNAVSEDYIDNLINYFTNAFSTLKREVTDPGLAYVMEKALADAAGGYFKVWVLPITKFTYYGGILSKDNAVKVFKYYDRLKRTLNSDGSGWRKPSDIILNSIAITVVPFSHVPRTRSMKDPCQHIAYYENTDTGLTIPMPYIDWNESSHSMFLPLKNQSIVKLDSPSSSEAILKYYDIAESCCHAKNPDGCSDFDLRFQDWLSSNFVPHMNDDNLYIAFGSLLSLMDKSNEFIKRTSNLCEYDSENDKSTVNSLLGRLPPWMTSNKFLILMFVLFIEIIWCIPAIFYIICSRRRRKSNQRSKFFLDVFRLRKRDRCHTVGRTDNSKERKNMHHNDPKQMAKNYQSHTSMMEKGIKVCRKPRLRDLEVDTQCPSNILRQSIGQVTSGFSDITNYDHECQCESVTLINEKKPQDAIHSSHIQTNLLSVSKEIKNNVHPGSFLNVQKLETTITKIVRDKNETSDKLCNKNSSNNKTVIRTSSAVKHKLQNISDKDKNNELCPCSRCIDSDKTIIGMGTEDEQKLQEISDKDTKNELCPCTCCIEEDGRDVKKHKTSVLKDARALKVKNHSEGVTRLRNVRDTTNKTRLPKTQPKVNVSKVNAPRVNVPRVNVPGVNLPRAKVPRVNVPKANVMKGDVVKNINVNKSKGLKLNSGEPLIEIRIDKPPAEITLDVFKRCHKNARPSRIPRLATGTNATEENSPRHGIKKASVCSQETSNMVKKRSMEDLNVKTKTTAKHNKMNVTL